MGTKAKGLTIVLAVLIFVQIAACSGLAAKEEARGMWVVRDQLTSPEKIQKFIQTAVKYNFNFLVVQVVGRGDAYYRSEILPRSEALKDQPESFDPLQMTIDLAHAKGIKVIAWLNDMYLCAFKANPVSKQHLFHAHPEWVTSTVEGVSLINMEKPATGPEIEGIFLDPGVPGVKEHIASRYREIVTKYNVDGVHHDYIRYANPNLGYNPEVRRLFQEKYGYDPLELKTKTQELKKAIGVQKFLDLEKAWDQFRRDSLTAIVKAVYEAVKAVKPQVEVSAAVIGYYKDAYSYKLQDWKLWLAEGYLDVAMPMIYEPQTEVVKYMIDQALSMQGKGVVFPGLGAYTQLGNVGSLIEKVQYARQKGVKGFLFFDYGSMVGTEGYLDGLLKGILTEPSKYPQILQ